MTYPSSRQAIKSLSTALAMILCGSVYVQARTLSESEALQVAQAFISGHRIDMGSNLMVAKQRGSHRAPGVAAAYYVFNPSPVCDALKT